VRTLAAIALLLAATAPAEAERLISTISNQAIQINSSFDGETVSLFGSIEPDRAQGETVADGIYNVIIVVEGPLISRVARQKTNVAGIWINTDQVTFDRFPSYYHVLSSGRLSDITNIVTLTTENILPDTKAREAARAGWYESVVFGRELVRLMTEKGLFGIHEQGVQFLSDTAYTARLTLPSDIPNGPFIAHTYVFENGAIVAKSSEGFSVRKSGFERFLGLAAVQQPFLYGIVCVCLALGTGWLGGVVFRR
jgi:uncharacterized protein (TIGR02186 family)